MNESTSNAERNTTASFVETLQEFVGLDLTQESQWTLEDKESRKTQNSTTYGGLLRKCEQGIHMWKLMIKSVNKP